MADDDTRDDLDDAIDDREDSDDVNDIGDDDTDDTDDDAASDWKPPTKKEWERQQAALKRARRQAQRLREGRGGSDSDDSDRSGSDGDEDQGMSRGERRIVRAEAKAALISAGADPDLVPLALGKLPSKVEYNDDDEPELSDWLEDMQDRYPKLFEKTTVGTRRRAPDIDQGRASGRRSSGGGTAQTSAQVAGNGIRRRPGESLGSFVKRVGQAGPTGNRGRRV